MTSLNTPLPTPEELLALLESAGSPLSMREIAHLFHLKGQARAQVRGILKSLEKEGKLQRRGKIFARAQATQGPKTMMVRVVRPHDKGVWVVPSQPQGGDDDTGEQLWIADPKGRLEAGDEVLVSRQTSTLKVLRILKHETQTLSLGLFESIGEGGLFIPASRKDRQEYVVAPDGRMNAQNGDFVEAQVRKEGGRRFTARITKVFGALERGSLSPADIAIAQYDLPQTFPDKALAQANAAKPMDLGEREDLRHLPLVTIDDEDARDFDDAIFAEKDTDPGNPDGWKLVVAIADVAAYVEASSPLDDEAYKRGNSVYFPDRVIPMLPEALSNELCSLKPMVDRACMAVFMTIDRQGKLKSSRFTRGLMRSVARLTYKQVQEAVSHGTLQPSWDKDLVPNVITPLFGAYEVLLGAREKRGALEINLPEQKVLFNDKGEVKSVEPRLRFESHRLIEEFMVLANVAAAITLDEAHLPCMFRIHDEPSMEKVEALMDFLKNSPLELAKGQRMSPKVFNQLIGRAVGSPMERAVNELVLRTQAQAEYNPQNIGHFGLGLARYCHFTSPIRRYADLLVHRALLQTMKTYKTPHFSYTNKDFEEIGQHLSQTERRAAMAERETLERYQALRMMERVGEVFTGFVSGVTDFALFISLEHEGVSGILPLRDLGSDYYTFDPKHHRVVGKRTKRVFALGDKVKVRLEGAMPLKGALSFVLADDRGARTPTRSSKPAPKGHKERARPPKASKKSHRKH